MAEPIRMRIREGCRGGQEQFTWGSIKEQSYKDREMYLGQSTKVGQMGKFGRYYVHDWYARKRDSAEHIDSERSAVQAYEEELMQEALGMKPKKLLIAKKQLTEEEMKELLTKDGNKAEDKKGKEAMGPQKKVVTNEYGEQVSTTNEDYVAEAARDAPIKGIGFAHHRNTKLESMKAETLGTVGQLRGQAAGPKMVKDESYVKLEMQVKKEEPHEEGTALSSSAVKAEGLVEVKQEHATSSSKRRREEEEEEVDKRRLSKAEKKMEKKRKKADKKQKKMEKKLKKAAKKEKKAAKAAKEARKVGRRMSASSSSSSSSSS